MQLTRSGKRTDFSITGNPVEIFSDIKTSKKLKDREHYQINFLI